MLALSLAAASAVRRVLAIGCHADDLEIGCGGTVLALTRAHAGRRGALGRARGAEGERAARPERVPRSSSPPRRADDRGPRVPGRYMPYHGETVKEAFEDLKRASTPSSSSRTRATTCIRTTGSRAS